MSNVFDKIGDIRNNINRSVFDWSHANNVTTGLGRITPIFCEELPPNSSLKIKANLGLQFMPMMYPVQTRMKVSTSFYKIPLRTLWKDYMNWVSSPNDDSSTYVPPFISGTDINFFGSNGMLKVSGIADYLGVPVTVTLPGFDSVPNDLEFDPQAMKFTNPSVGGSLLSNASDLVLSGVPADATYGNGKWSSDWAGVSVTSLGDVSSVGTYGCTLTFTFSGSSEKVQSVYDFVKNRGGQNVPLARLVLVRGLTATVEKYYDVYQDDFKFNLLVSPSSFTIRFKVFSTQKDIHLYLLFPNCAKFVNGSATASKTTLYFTKVVDTQDGGVFPIDKETSPYYNANSASSIQANQVRLSAYPFRAYEAVYNAYIRNIKNNPFKKAGKAVYNEWITTDEGGEDKTFYRLYHANWYSDMFTTALPSPQQGKAPLVGLTTYSKSVTDENGHTQTEMAYALVDEDGKRYKVNFESNDEELKGVTYSELGNDVALAPYSLVNAVTSGISINDFRNVNAYQRYLELNQFRGYSYKEIIEGRFDVNVKFDALQMPEYLGGFTRDVNMSSITQTVETSSSGSYSGALGSQSGLAYASSNSETISVFSDEDCIVLGIMYVVPLPVYTQSLPKFFTYRDRLDYFAPEFDHIGYQPITIKELAPVQQWIADKTKLDNTFGYQRPWYQYCQKNDKACGIFRTELRNFLINRVFNGVPELGASFTTVNEDDVNDVFSVTETTDKIFGQLYFDIEAKLPISRVVVPKLE
nr:MAG TPA: Major capsid protein [Microviridae sp.]